MLISLDKQYTTRHGVRVELIRIDDIGLYPVIGTIVGIATQTSWSHNGAYVHEGKEHHYDLIEVKSETDSNTEEEELSQPILGQKMKITLDKKYTTDNSKEVRIYDIDGKSPYSVHGAVLDKGTWYLLKWTEDGHTHISSCYNVYNLKEMWIPSLMEPCLFWDNDTLDNIILLRFAGMNGSRFEGKYTEDEDNWLFYDNCMKFTGELPIHFRDAK